MCWDGIKPPKLIIYIKLEAYPIKNFCFVFNIACVAGQTFWAFKAILRSDYIANLAWVKEISYLNIFSFYNVHGVPANRLIQVWLQDVGSSISYPTQALYFDTKVKEPGNHFCKWTALVKLRTVTKSSLSIAEFLNLAIS